MTVATVSDALLKTIVAPDNGKPPVVPSMYPRIAAGLERKGQLILYGPPGTGKTYQARRFAVWWLMRRLGREEADAVFVDADRLREAERELSTSQVSSRVWGRWPTRGSGAGTSFFGTARWSMDTVASSGTIPSCNGVIW